ncbi:MAG: response regulator transcription factor [Planctomycetota bacterium]
MIRTVVAGDIHLYREGIVLALQDTADMDVVAVATNAYEAVQVATKNAADVLLLDMAMPLARRVLREAKLRASTTRVVALTVPEEEEELLRCADAGVSAFVTRAGTLDDLIQAVRDAHSGELHCPPRIAGALLRRVAGLANGLAPDSRFAQLTRREQSVLGLIERGMSNKEISCELYISVSTTKQHVHSVLTKLGVRTRTEAAALAHRVGFGA